MTTWIIAMPSAAKYKIGAAVVAMLIVSFLIKSGDISPEAGIGVIVSILAGLGIYHSQKRGGSK